MMLTNSSARKVFAFQTCVVLRSEQLQLDRMRSLVHTESWAVDLAWDVIARFGGRVPLPREFYDDFVMVAADEARHYSLLQARILPADP